MRNNIVNISKIDSLCNSINDDIYNLNNNLNKIENLIEELSLSFNINRQNQQYSDINEKNIYILKKYIEKLNSFKIALKKVSIAYMNVENDFSSKKII